LKDKFVSTLLTATFVFLLPGVGALAAVALVVLGRVTALDLVLFAVGFLLTGFGITIGYHRLLTHRSFETSPAVKGVLLVLGSMAAEGGVTSWVANHVKHHAYSEQREDPHSPTAGFLHSHWGWLFAYSDIDVEKYAAPALRDGVARWVSKTFVLWVIVGYVVPFLIAGWEGLIWGGLFRHFAVQNVTFAVNSVCHRWGTHPYKTNDLSKNNWVVGVIGLGEGWHNNHHAFPTSAFHGLCWWQLDLSGWVISWLEASRLVWNVKRAQLSRIPSLSA
jgi:stearoyl-CoA desaturase (delta-9 desaturase)